MSHARRLVICCDGTWQSSVTWRENIPSNVTKLCRVIARHGRDSQNPKKEFEQIVYYDSGVGTGSLSWFEKTRQGGTGDGLAENVIEAYNFLVNNFEEGDEIFCFGFSRGAYTARAVAGLVTDMGVIRPEHMQKFASLYSAYKTPNFGDPEPKNSEEEKPFKQSSAWKRIVKDENAVFIPNSNIVQVVGVWDTVGSLGIPDGRILNNSSRRQEYAFHNVKLGDRVRHAFHALALDERRKAFGPTLWYVPNKLIKQDPPAELPELKQCWFPGVHINNGGGSDDSFDKRQGDFESMANITFAWMLQCIYPYLTIDVDAYIKYVDYYFEWTKKQKFACTHHTKTWGDTAYEIADYIPFVNPDLTTKPDKEHEHLEIERSWGLGPFVDDAQGKLYSYAGAVPRTPGECQIEVREGKAMKIRKLKELGRTHEYMHPVAEYRNLKRTCKEPATAPPKMLQNFERKFVNGRYEWNRTDVKKDEVKIPEWIIMNPGGFNFERHYYEKCLEAKKYDNKAVKIGAAERASSEEDWLGKLDKEVNFGLVKDHKLPFDYP